MTYQGADWVARNVDEQISPFGREVADILGGFARGIYHIEGKPLHRANWRHAEFIEVSIYGELSTFDDSNLTALVLLAHDRNIRVGIRGCGPRYVRVSFMRVDTGRTVSDKHPTLEAAAARLRAAIGHEVVAR